MKETNVIETQTNLFWLPVPNEVCLVLDSRLPPLELITSVFAFAFRSSALLLTQLCERGWDVPGGHVEQNESPEAAVRREVFEECGCILGHLQPFAHQHIRLLGTAPSEYPYPFPESYQVFYFAEIEELSEFVPTDESSDRSFFGPDAAQELPWVQKNRLLYQSALRIAQISHAEVETERPTNRRR